MRNRNRNRLGSSSVCFLLLTLTLLIGTEANLMAAGSVALDGTLGHSGTLAGPNYAIPDTVGRRAGNNLFHSFGTFSVGTGESATFSGEAGISNIIGRVTGGAPSSIDGMIRSTIDGANLFLLNPSGILFGPNARLDVKGSFHASTADYLKFDNGEIFSVSTATPPVLSVAQPSAFGFLTATPAAITIDRSVLEVPAGQTVSIVGGDLTIRNDPAAETYFDYVNFLPGPTYYTLSAPSGRINLASVASPGEFSFSDQNPGVSSFARLGRIELLDSANLNVSSDFFGSGPAGNVVIRGGEMLLIGMAIDASGSPPGNIDIAGGSLTVDATPLSILNYGDVDHPGTAASISLTNAFTMKNSSTIDSSAVAGGKGGGIVLTAGTIEMSGESYLSSQTFGTGAAGNISLTASTINLFDAPYIDTSTSGPARGGNIVLNSPTITLGNSVPGAGFGPIFGTYGYIGSRSNPGATGRGGDISLIGKDITVQNGFFVATATLDAGNAGNITVQTGSLNCLNQGNIASNAYASGTGGTVDVTATNILLSAKDKTLVENMNSISGLGAQVRNYSSGGKIRVTAENLQIHDGGKISSVLYGAGKGSDIEIVAKNISIDGYNLESQQVYALSAIDARLFDVASTGTGGNITLRTDALSISHGGAIRSALQLGSPGNAGDIAITAKSIDISSRGQIYADSFRGSGSSSTEPSTGNSGNITVNADQLTVTGAKYIPRPAPLDFDFTGISTTTNAGVGGNVTVTLTGGDLRLKEEGGIRADTQGTGLGGTITLAAKNIILDSGSINASSSGSGNAGDVAVTADILSIGNSGLVSTSTSQAGAGGVVNITSGALALTDSGRITSSTTGIGKAGTITVSLSGDLLVTGNATITADTAGAGKGGSISVAADTVTLSAKGSLAAASTGTGDAGNVSVAANNILIADRGSISTRTDSTGSGGTITIGTGLLQMESGGQISSSSGSSGNAGNISITATDSVYVRDSSITTEALLADGGNIAIKAPNTIRFDNSTLTASVNGEKETVGGNILIDPRFVLLKGSDVVATAHKGTGGNIDITSSVFLADNYSVVSAASELGFPGTVSINAPNTVSGLIAPLSSDIVSSAALLRERCIARIREGKYSSFIVGGRDGIPIEPGNMIPGIMQ